MTSSFAHPLSVVLLAPLPFVRFDSESTSSPSGNAG